MTPAEQHITDAQGAALRAIATAAVTARSRWGTWGPRSVEDANRLLCDVEHALASLIALGAVPGETSLRIGVDTPPPHVRILDPSARQAEQDPPP